ncbi:CaiB/BaiF CoA transferase family protein [Dactylosporangium sp. CA-092794]|uniref:CaiB/BaiF CoA transferase family protein n=1 Tax=Dactylosporangium sp. CA-092794 TaxID=3239929 RepID=UPI003D8E9C38
MVSPGALDGIRVLGVEHFISGPFCTQILADQGADVIKVESPHHDQRNGYFHTLNRNKRSIILDLRTDRGRQIMRALVATADVLVTNFGAGVPDKLGFGYSELREINPRLVYVHITGFGRDTPYEDRPAFDGVIQAMSGLMHLTGEPDGPPMLGGIFIPDHLAGLYAALATSFGLQRRALTGEGSFTDLAMLDCLMSFQASSFQEVLNWHESPQRIGSRVRGSFASTYQASDGYLYLAPLTAKMWEGVAAVIGQPWILEYFSTGSNGVDTRLEHRQPLDAAIETWTRAHTVAEATAAMQAAGVAASPILSIEDIVADPHVQARRLIRQVPDINGVDSVYVPASPLPVIDKAYDIAPPDAGEDTEAIIAELGLADSTGPGVTVD